MKAARRGALAVALWLGLAVRTALADEIDQQLQQARQDLQAGRAEQAALIFEGILLQQPWRLEVWVDYALALRQTGDQVSVRAILRNLRQQNPPPALQVWLDQQLSLVEPTANPWQWGGSIDWQVGHDSNLNRAPTASALTLTLPTGLVSLPLAMASRSRPGDAGLLRLDWLASHQDEAAGWGLQASLNARQVSAQPGQNYLQIGAGVTRQWRDETGGYQWVVAGQNLQYGGVDVQRSGRLGLYRNFALLNWAGSNCEPTSGIELEHLAYPATPVLDANYLGGTFSMGCGQQTRWQNLLRIGLEKAEHLRPGGDQQRLEWQGRVDGAGGRGNWQIHTELGWQADQSGYSAWLNYNAPRRITRSVLRLTYRYPLAVGIEAHLSAETFAQRSNLALFSLHGDAVWLGCGWAF